MESWSGVKNEKEESGEWTWRREQTGNKIMVEWLKEKGGAKEWENNMGPISTPQRAHQHVLGQPLANPQSNTQQVNKTCIRTHTHTNRRP